MTTRRDPTVIETPDERLGHLVGNVTMMLYPLCIVGLFVPRLVQTLAGHGWWTAVGVVAGMAWSTVIIISIIICWRPARWTVCTRWGTVRVQAHSAPDWLGVQAAGSVALSFLAFLPDKSGDGPGYTPLFLAPLILGLVALLLARICYLRGKSSGRGSLHLAYSELFTGKKV